MLAIGIAYFSRAVAHARIRTRQGPGLSVSALGSRELSKEKPMSAEAKCPFNHGASALSGTTNRDWWPKQLRLELLNQHSTKSDPMDADFDYAAEFKSLDYAALKK